ncbi:MAG TPA: SOS response-associated peptidase [Patescibacteria group bacterium]|nr:SOS response-associated peptidase [Patescibacteria group bacterium]
MTERFTLLESFDALAAQYGARPFRGEDWAANYNISPRALIPVIVEEPEGRELRLMQWGLVPFWAKADKIGASLINAPVGELAEKPGLRDSFKDKRCLIPASGFYVWQKLSTVKKPYYVAPEMGLLTFAGLWSSWVSPASIEVETCSIVTMPATGAVKPVSDTVPLALAKENFDLWLSKSAKQRTMQDMLAASALPCVTMVPVSKYVNAAKSSGPKCIAPVETQ